MREVYLDNAATTRVRPEVAELMVKVMEEDYGNPSSKHTKGMESERYLKAAREQIAKTLKCKPQEIIFTSGGTESNNMAIIGTALKRSRRGKHIISMSIEHAAVYKPMEFLISQGYEVEFIGVDSEGHIDLQKLEESIRPDTILVSVMAVNNEIGSVEPIDRIGEIIKSVNPQCYFHTDCIQAYGKLKLRPKAWHVDMLSVSSHKFHGPKGCGFLFIDEKCNVSPIIFGGGQQKDMRSGTDNVPGIAGMGLAAEMYYHDFDRIHENLLAVKGRLIERLSAMDGVTVNTGKTFESELPSGIGFAPHIVSAGFLGVRAEVLLHALEEKGVFVSSGSACSSNHPQISGTLQAIGTKKELLDSTLRFSFGIYSTVEDADYAADCIEELLPVLRKFTHY